jgi:hypothetical protein
MRFARGEKSAVIAAELPREDSPNTYGVAELGDQSGRVVLDPPLDCVSSAVRRPDELAAFAVRGAG